MRKDTTKLDTEELYPVLKAKRPSAFASSITHMIGGFKMIQPLLGVGWGFRAPQEMIYSHCNNITTGCYRN